MLAVLNTLYCKIENVRSFFFYNWDETHHPIIIKPEYRILIYILFILQISSLIFLFLISYKIFKNNGRSVFKDLKILKFWKKIRFPNDRRPYWIKLSNMTNLCIWTNSPSDCNFYGLIIFMIALFARKVKRCKLMEYSLVNVQCSVKLRLCCLPSSSLRLHPLPSFLLPPHRSTWSPFTDLSAPAGPPVKIQTTQKQETFAPSSLIH